jgi:arylformamidase
VGVDYLSIGSRPDNPAVHNTLLGSDICVIEGLNLREISAGEYDMVCLPLLIKGADGAPARIVVRKRA